MLVRATRWTLLVAIVLFTGVVAWLATHPASTAPWLSRLATRHLLGAHGSVRFADYAGNPLRGVTLYDVTLTLPGAGGGTTEGASGVRSGAWPRKRWRQTWRL